MNPIKWLVNKIPKAVIYNCENNKYLTRWYLFRRERFAFFLHLFHRSDEDRALHDHPWTFISFILWRGYWEHYYETIQCPQCRGSGMDHLDDDGFELDRNRKCGTCRAEKTIKVYKRSRRWPLQILYRPAEWTHRVELIKEKPTLTLILRFRGRRKWGYHFPDGWISHADWWNANCE